VLAGLQLVREKYENASAPSSKKRDNSSTSADILLGRALYLPIVITCFTLCMIIRLSPFVVFLHLLFLGAYGVFYWQNVKQALGLDQNYSLLDEASSGFHLS
jgi:hypothetical protein